MPSKSDATLHVAATPLGNLEDVTPRLRHVLATAKAIYAEDTRRSRILLSHMGLQRPLQSLHAHNEQHRRTQVLAHLEAGDDVVLLTDAGTPAISDPGADAVDAAHAAGYRVSPVAGPSALTAALSVAGFAGSTGAVLFVGFFARPGAARRQALAELEAHRGTYVFFEAPNRLAETLAALAQRTPERLVCVCREMTKAFEECVRGSTEAVLAWAQAKPVRGEVTVVVGPPPARADAESQADDAALSAALRRCLDQAMSARDAAAAVSAVLDVPRRRAYTLCLQLQPQR